MSLGAAGLGTAARLEAQTVVGTVLTDEPGGEAVAGALVTLLDEDGSEGGSDLTGPDGAFRISARSTGRYRVRVERIGFERWESELIELGSGETRSLALRIPVRPVQLSGLHVRVEGGEECVRSPGQTEGVLAVWNEARKALERTVWTEERRPYRYSVSLWERELDLETLVARDETRRTQRGLARTPFYSLSPAELIESGFVTREDAEIEYFAPDAEVLLSSEFLGTHCFGIRREEREGRRLIGLVFEPLRSTRIPDIWGVMWLDQESAQLEAVEYRYRNLPIRVAADEAGGRVEFHALPDGGFIVRRWYVRMPMVFEEFLWSRVVRGDRRRQRLIGYEEDGGEVIAIHTPEGRRVRLIPGGSVGGRAVAPSAADAAAGGIVTLSGPGGRFETALDTDGAFHIEAVPAGRYRLRLDHSLLDALRLEPEEVGLAHDVSVEDGIHEEVRLGLPGLDALFETACPDADATANVGAIAGRIRTAEGPLANAAVRAAWERREDLAEAGAPPSGAIHGSTGEDGRFLLCGVPGGLVVTLHMSHAATRAEAALALTLDRRIVVQNVTLSSSP